VKLLETEPEDLSDGASTPQVGLIDGSIPLSILSTDASRKLAHINEKRPSGNPITRYMEFIRQIMSPPLAASLASLFVAMIPPLQTFLTDYASPLKMALSNAGDCSIPLTLVVLGAYFWEPKPAKGGNIVIAGDDPSFELRIGTSAMKQPSRICRLSFSDESKTVIAALLTRMILVPLLIMPLLYYSAVAGLHSVFEECVASPLNNRI
jgi:predicted permease